MLDRLPDVEQVVYNITLEFRIVEFGEGVSKINNIRLYIKIKGESDEITKYKQVEEEIYNLPNHPNSVNASFSFNLTNVTGEVTVYSGASFDEFLTEGLVVGTCTQWFNVQAIILETPLETNYIGYLTIIIAISSLAIIIRRKKKKLSN
jgi:hypothetical protein